MKKLIIGEVPRNFNQENHILFNSYSLGVNEINFKNYPIYSFLDKNSIDFANLDKTSSTFALSYIKNNIKQFNTKFKLNQGYTFYKITLYPWLITVIQSYVERYLHLKTFQEKYNENVSVELTNNNKRIQFETVTDIHNAINDVSFNEWLTSLVIRNTPNNFKTIESERDYEFYKAKPKKKTLRDIFVGIIRNKYFRVHKVYGFSIFDHLFFSLLLFFKKSKQISDKKLKEFEENKNYIVSDFNYIPIDLLFELTMPNSIKNLHDIVQKKDRHFKKNKFLLGSQHIRSDDKYRVGIALAAQAGEKIIGCQHGGESYGLVKYCEEVNVNEFSQHKFVTWGWTEHSEYNQSFVRLPSPYLAKFINKHKKTTNQIIFVSTRMNQVNRFLAARPTQCEWYEHLQNQAELLSKMKKNDIKISYRPHPKIDGAIPSEKYLKSRIKNLDIHKGDLHKSLLKSNSVILDHPGTTLNISMAANIPTILYWKQGFFPLEENAKILFEKFKSKSIYFDDYEKLYEHIKKTNLQKWWAENDIQQLRKEFIKSHSFTKFNWRKDWVDFFCNE